MGGIRQLRVWGVAARVCADTVCFQLPFLGLYYFAIGLLEGRPWQVSYDRCRRDFAASWPWALLFWAPAQALNFAVVPGLYTAFVVNVFNGIWTTFLSLKHHHRDYIAEPAAGGL